MISLSGNSRTWLLIISLFIIVFTSSCYVTKNVPADDFALIQKKRNYFRVHSGEKIILITNCRIVDNILSGEAVGNIENVKPGDIADIYIAPPGSLNIDAGLTSLPIQNIAKIDYQGHDALSITIGSTLAFLFLVFPGLFAR